MPKDGKTPGIIRFFKTLGRFFKSRLGVVTLSIVAIGFGVGAAFCLSIIVPYNQNPLSLAAPITRTVRQKALDTQHEYKTVSQHNLVHSGDMVALEDNVEGRTCFYAVYTKDVLSACIDVSTNVVHERVAYQISFSPNLSGDSVAINFTSPYLGEVAFYDPTTTQPFLDNGSVHHSPLFYRIDELRNPIFEIDDTWWPNQFTLEEIDQIKKEAKDTAEAFFFDIIDTLTVLTGEDGIELYHALGHLREDKTNAMASAVLLIPIALFGTPLFGTALILWIRLSVEDRRIRLISKGVLDRRSISTAVAWNEGPVTEAVEEIPPEKEPEKTTPPPRQAAWVLSLEGFLARHHISPCLGEWVVRAVGLALVLIGSVLVSIARIARTREWAGAWNAFALATDYFDSISAAGALILVVAVITIIAETRRNLSFTAGVFFTAAITFYTVTSAFYCLMDMLIPMAEFSLGTLISAISGGNIFMGLGIFAILGFFLFENPPRWFINRKLFRALSVIPTLVAIASIVFSYLLRCGILLMPYWQSGIFFVRNFDGLFVGICTEYVVFGFREFLTHKYGEDKIEEQMNRDIVQFGKNTAICGLVLFFTIVFFALPENARVDLQMGKVTFGFMLIPLFLFQKPAGKDHKVKSDIIYYILYASTLGIPSLTGPIIDFFAMIIH